MESHWNPVRRINCVLVCARILKSETDQQWKSHLNDDYASTELLCNLSYGVREEVSVGMEFLIFSGFWLPEIGDLGQRPKCLSRTLILLASRNETSVDFLRGSPCNLFCADSMDRGGWFLYFHVCIRPILFVHPSARLLTVCILSVPLMESNTPLRKVSDLLIFYLIKGDWALDKSVSIASASKWMCSAVAASLISNVV